VNNRWRLRADRCRGGCAITVRRAPAALLVTIAERVREASSRERDSRRQSDDGITRRGEMNPATPRRSDTGGDRDACTRRQTDDAGSSLSMQAPRICDRSVGECACEIGASWATRPIGRGLSRPQYACVKRVTRLTSSHASSDNTPTSTPQRDQSGLTQRKPRDRTRISLFATQTARGTAPDATR
jgi:hypothetical protein